MPLKPASAAADREVHRTIALLKMQAAEANPARALAIGRKIKSVAADTLTEAKSRMGDSALASLNTDRSTQSSGVAVGQTQTSDAGEDDSVAEYKRGYDAGRAGAERNPGPVDLTDVASYNQGYDDGRKEAERTQTSASPAEQRLDTVRPKPVQTAPQQIAPEQKAPIGPPVSDAYQRGVDDATNFRSPVTVAKDPSERSDYTNGYESVLRRMEESAKKTADEKEGTAKEVGGILKTVGGGIADHQINQQVEHLVPHSPDIPWFALLEMMTELKGDTPQSTPEEHIKYMRERLQEIEIEPRQKDPLEDEQPDASIPDATTQ